MNLTPKRLTILVVLSFVLGIVWYGGLKYVLLKSDAVHYHANFALYINGQRDEFKSGVYYEEIQACTADHNDPRTRVHMHNNVNDVVHVHDKGVTWGQLFANLGYTLGDTTLVTRDNTYIEGINGNHLTFVLNGQPTSLLANRLIGNEDRLLINYGPEKTNELGARFSTVAHTAHEVNSRPDPASCSGGAEESTWHRLQRAVW